MILKRIILFTGMVCWCSLSSRVRKSFPGLYTGMITSISVNVILPFVKKLTLHHITNLVVLHPKHFFFSWKFFFLCVFSNSYTHEHEVSPGCALFCLENFVLFPINLGAKCQGADKPFKRKCVFVRPL